MSHNKTLPAIPNDMALLLALQELAKTINQIAELNNLIPGSGDFLLPFASDLKQVIQNYSPTSPVIHLGHYQLSVFDDNSIWIAHEDGEGMQVPNTTFIGVIEKLLEDF
jgi:hypothetical protein